MKFNLRQKSLDDFNPPRPPCMAVWGGFVLLLQRGTKKTACHGFAVNAEIMARR